MIFTSGVPEVANRILDALDPKQQLFSFRFFREHCYPTEKGFFIKDLRILNRAPNSVVLVDNAAYSYGFQPFNGIPIVPFEGDPDDAELIFLAQYLDYLYDKEDVRKVNKEHFKYHLYLEGYSTKKLVRKLFK